MSYIKSYDNVCEFGPCLIAGDFQHVHFSSVCWCPAATDVSYIITTAGDKTRKFSKADKPVR